MCSTEAQCGYRAPVEHFNMQNVFCQGWAEKGENMEYKKFEDTYVVRLDKGEEIITSLTRLADKENIRLASVSGLGAVNSFTAGVFFPEEKVYRKNDFHGNFEITSLTGTITRMDGKPYLHLHLSAGNEYGKVMGGHLNSAIVSATCEVVVRTINGEAGRVFSKEVGLNIFDM